MGLNKTAADAVSEIAYAAFSTHFRTVYAAQFRPGQDPHAIALEHWNKNLPHVATLWHGLTKGIIQNTANAQAEGLIPPLLTVTDAPAQALPGLGGAPAKPDSLSPAALARRIRDGLRAKQEERRQASPMPDAGTLDVAPGLAIGRCTETVSPSVSDPGPCDPGPSDGGSCGGSDGGGGGGD